MRPPSHRSVLGLVVELVGAGVLVTLAQLRGLDFQPGVLLNAVCAAHNLDRHKGHRHRCHG